METITKKMGPRPRPAAVLVFLVLLLASFASRAAEKTLTRVEDFVVLTGQDLSPLFGVETSSLRLYSCQENKCGPVPVQVDKVDVLGRYVFPQDLNADRDGTILDANDELSFMAGDAGDPRPEGFRPPAASRGLELELRDPRDQGRGWVYLFAEPGTPPPTTPDYVSFSLQGDSYIIQSSQYALGLKKGRIAYDLMRMRTPEGKLGLDVLDRQRVGLEAKLSGDRGLEINAPESIILSEFVGWIDGNVRVIIDELVKVHLGTLSFQWGTENFNRYYRCGQNNSVFFEFPGSARDMLITMLMYWSLDFTPDVIGSVYLDPVQPGPLRIEDEEKNNLPGDRAHYWWALYGPQGSVLQALDLDEDIRPFFACEGRWRQHPDPSRKQGEVPGKLEIGFNCHEAGQMPDRSAYRWQNYILFPATPTPEGIEGLRNLFERPLEVQVRVVPPPA